MSPWKPLAALVLLALVATPAVARDDRDQRPRGAGGIAPEDAADTVRRATGARVLGVQRDGSEDNGYRVRVLTRDGTVRSIRVDRGSGRIRD